MEKSKSCISSADRNPRCKLCTRRRMGSRCEYFPAKKRSAAEEEFSASYRPRRNFIVNAKRKNRKVDRLSWSVIAPKSGHRKTELRPFQTTLPWLSWPERHYWKKWACSSYSEHISNWEWQANAKTEKNYIASEQKGKSSSHWKGQLKANHSSTVF